MSPFQSNHRTAHGFRTSRLVALGLAVFGLMDTTPAGAARVTKSTSTQALIDLEGDEASPEAEFDVLDDGERKTAVVRITKVKNGKAIGTILRGAAAVGATLRPASVGTPKDVAGHLERSDSSRKSWSSSRVRLGLDAGYAMNSMALPVERGADFADAVLYGESLAASVWMDLPLSERFFLRAAIRHVPLSLSGDVVSDSGNEICENGTSALCSVEYQYVGGTVSGQIAFHPGGHRIWAGLGYSLYLARSSTTSVPNLTTVGSTNQSIWGGAGYDFALARNWSLPFRAEYDYFPGSEVVTGRLGFSGGLSYSF